MRSTIFLTFLIFSIALVMFITAGCSQSSPTLAPPSTTNTVTITIPSGAMSLGSAAFGTNPLHVPLNSEVVWANSDSVTHHVVSNTALWDTGDITGGATSGSVEFTSNGTYPYHCSIHPTMTGEIIVP